MLDLFRETWGTMKKNKLRTFLTGMSMSWGIFILIVLLGTGNGYVNGIKNDFYTTTTNIVDIYPGFTTIDYKGLKKGREIPLRDNDVEMIRSRFNEVSAISPSLSVYGNQLVYKTESMNSATLTGVTMDRFGLLDFKLLKGRMFNEIDMNQARKVVLIDNRTEEVLFKGGDPIGSMITIDGISLQVVGVYDTPNNSQGGEAYLPLSTIRALFPTQKDVNDIAVVLEGIESVEQSESFVKSLRSAFAHRHSFDPEDKTAVRIYNMFKYYSEVMTIFSGLNMFLWLIGLGTMVSGVVGIANIMLVTVKERTKEFGIRKALGAPSKSIIGLVLSESLCITVIFGYIGMLFGIGLLKVLSMVLSSMGNEDIPFMNPSVGWGIILGATLIMIAVALVAAYIPAKRSVSVKPVEALNYE